MYIEARINILLIFFRTLKTSLNERITIVTLTLTLQSRVSLYYRSKLCKPCKLVNTQHSKEKSFIKTDIFRDTHYVIINYRLFPTYNLLVRIV